jgi:DnaJ-class molecular chaperone
MDNKQANYYEILGIKPTASIDQIKRKFNDLIFKQAENIKTNKILNKKIIAEFKITPEILLIKETLLDPKKKAEYDKLIKNNYLESNFNVIQNIKISIFNLINYLKKFL